MPISDLTHKIHSKLLLYPGTPEIEVTNIKTVINDGFAEGKLSFTSHIGTHLDAPAHMIANGATLDSLSIERFVGSAIVIDIKDLNLISIDNIKKPIEQFGRTEWVIFRSFWSDKWGTPDYFTGFPILDPNAVDFLLKINPSGIAIDACSFDPVESTTFFNHLQLLGAGILLGENFTNLSLLPTNQIINLSVLPLFWNNADGAPARVVAQW